MRFCVIKSVFRCALLSFIIIITFIIIIILPAFISLHTWTQTPRRRLQPPTPFYLLLFMSFPLYYFFIFCHPPYTFDLPPQRLPFHRIDFHFELVMAAHKTLRGRSRQHMQKPQCSIFLHLLCWSPTTHCKVILFIWDFNPAFISPLQPCIYI